jgi:glutathione S-transferase
MLTLYYHPLSSFCWKVLIALHERRIAFTPRLVDLGDADDRAAFARVWPIAKFPVLRDGTTGMTFPESSIIIEYLDGLRSEQPQLIDTDPEAALQTRLWDRFYDHYVHVPMQKVVGDRLRAADARDPHGVAEARATIDKAYDYAATAMAYRHWATGDAFTMADCAAAPALWYANRVQPFGPGHGALAGYLERLEVRASFARVLTDAGPYMHMFPE